MAIFDLKNTPPADTIRMAAAYLHHITLLNDVVPHCRILTRFHARTIPSIDILGYLSRILKYAPCGSECFLAMLIYFERMAQGCIIADPLVEGSTANSSSSSSSAAATVDISASTSGSFANPSAPAALDPALTGSTALRATTNLVRTHNPISTNRHPIVINSYNIHRLLVAGVMVAVKFLSDVFYSNSHIAKVGGLPVQELNRLEIEFLLFNEFNLNVNASQLQECGNNLLEFELDRQASLESHIVLSPLKDTLSTALAHTQDSDHSVSNSSDHPNATSSNNGDSNTPASECYAPVQVAEANAISHSPTSRTLSSGETSEQQQQPKPDLFSHSLNSYASQIQDSSSQHTTLNFLHLATPLISDQGGSISEILPDANATFNQPVASSDRSSLELDSERLVQLSAMQSNLSKLSNHRSLFSSSGIDYTVPAIWGGPPPFASASKGVRWRHHRKHSRAYLSGTLAVAGHGDHLTLHTPFLMNDGDDHGSDMSALSQRPSHPATFFNYGQKWHAPARQCVVLANGLRQKRQPRRKLKLASVIPHRPKHSPLCWRYNHQRRRDRLYRWIQARHAFSHMQDWGDRPTRQHKSYCPNHAAGDIRGCTWCKSVPKRHYESDQQSPNLISELESHSVMQSLDITTILCDISNAVAIVRASVAVEDSQRLQGDYSSTQR